MLRCFIGKAQDNWDDLLPGLEFAYNNFINDTTNYSPFFLTYGQDPFNFPDLIFSEQNKPMEIDENYVKEFLSKIKIASDLAKQAIINSNDKTINKKSGKKMNYQIGDKVLLSTQHLKLKTKKKKLSPKFIGPFTISEIYANGNSYKLDLPAEYKTIHPSFHVSLLKPFHSNNNDEEKIAENNSLELETPKREIQEVLEEGYYDGVELLKVRYKNHDPSEDEWIPKQQVFSFLKFLVFFK